MHSRDAESAVIGGVALVGDRFDDVAEIVMPEDFENPDLRGMWEAIEYVAHQGKVVDSVLVIDRLQSLGVSPGPFAQIVHDTSSAANVIAHAQRVRDRSIERQLSRAGAQIRTLADEPGDINTKLDRAQSLVMGVADVTAKSGRGPVLIKKILSQVIDAVDERFQNGGRITGLSTGFVDFDHRTAGLHPADLIIIAGRPAMGKTSFAMNIAEHQVLAGNAVAMFSLEMSAEQLAERELASLARIDFQRFRVGDLSDEDWTHVTAATGRLAESRLLIDDTPALTVHELRARARRLHREHKLSLVIVDYIQLMSGESKRENSNERVAEISKGLKSLAKELNVPVIALSQLNRGLEQRANKRPVMSDLRDSGQIEQDADLIVFLYRDEVYDSQSPYAGLAEAIIGKQRNGPLGTTNLTFLGNYVRFENFTGEWPQPRKISQSRVKGGFDYAQVEH